MAGACEAGRQRWQHAAQPPSLPHLLTHTHGTTSVVRLPPLGNTNSSNSSSNQGREGPARPRTIVLEHTDGCTRGACTIDNRCVVISITDNEASLKLMSVTRVSDMDTAGLAHTLCRLQ